MPEATDVDQQALAVVDDRPFFARALAYGVRQGIIDAQRLAAIRDDAPKGMVQIAEYFGTQYLRANIEEARVRIVSLVSLYLEEKSGGNLELAARSLRDNTFLSHSRGGSEMLKRVWAMPEDTSLGIPAETTQKQFLADWSLRSPTAYRQLLAQRQRNEATMAAALELAEGLGEARSEMWTVAVETVIRSALLTHLGGQKGSTLPDAGAFAGLLAAIRKKGIGARARKQLQALLETLEDRQQAIVRHELGKLEREDLPRIMDHARPLDEVIHALEPLYYLRDSGPDDASRFDAMAGEEWQKITRGKTDDHSLLTVFLCLATETPPKTALTRSAARALVRKMRHDGLRPLAVLNFIRTCAPHAMQEDLETLWHEFLPEAESGLLDADDTTLSEAMAFLRENCVLL